MINRFHIVSFTSRLPIFIQKIPYTICLGFSKYYLKLTLSCVEEVWPRHGYLTSYFVAGLSDLDLTIIFRHPPTPQELVEIDRKIKYLKKIIPPIKEINSYSRPVFDKMKPFFNPIEISRDPKLLNFFAISQSAPTTSFDVLVFLLRTIDSNRKNLGLISQLRIQKWEYYLALTGANLSGLNDKSLKQEINSYLEKILRNENIMTNFFLEKVISDQLEEHELFVLFPHRWINQMAIERRFESLYQLEIIRTSLPEARLIISDLKWEISGIASQIDHLDLKHRKSLHYLLNLILIFVSSMEEKFLEKECREIIDGINFLKKYLERNW